MDRRSHIGGNAYDCYDDAGILIHKYGPHIFHTASKEVFDYLSRFTAWRQYQHKVLASVDEIEQHTLLTAFEEQASARRMQVGTEITLRWRTADHWLRGVDVALNPDSTVRLTRGRDIEAACGQLAASRDAAAA